MKEADKTDKGDSVGFVGDDYEASPLRFGTGVRSKRKVKNRRENATPETRKLPAREPYSMTMSSMIAPS